MTIAASDGPQPDDQSAVIAFLASGQAFGGVRPERIDTHAAILFLVGDRAWKMKRAVRYPYLDFSTAERRHAALDAELRLNRRTAPSLYLALHTVTRAGDGRLTLDGVGDVVDWLLEMRRFAADALLGTAIEAGAVDEKLLARLADRIAAFHADAAVAADGDGHERVARVVNGNRISMERFPDVLAPVKVAELAARTNAMIASLRERLDERARCGRVRHCHGDLHLANIAVIEGEPTLFDCLEFDEDLATSDILYDLAFLLMDLWHRGRRAEANMLFNRYLDVSPQDEDGIALMPLFLSMRAAVRAHVHAATVTSNAGAAETANAYLALAIDLLDPVTPVLVAVGGLSGTGKSSMARAIGGYLGRAPGARILRSDVRRKALAGLAPEQRLPAESYTAEASRQVYADLARETTSLLRSGQAVIVDAQLATAEERTGLRKIAADAGAEFEGLWLDAPLATRLARIAARTGDASDADVAVASRQEPVPADHLAGWRIVAVDAPVRAIVEELMRHFAARGLVSLSQGERDA